MKSNAYLFVVLVLVQKLTGVKKQIIVRVKFFKLSIRTKQSSSNLENIPKYFMLYKNNFLRSKMDDDKFSISSRFLTKFNLSSRRC